MPGLIFLMYLYRGGLKLKCLFIFSDEGSNRYLDVNQIIQREVDEIIPVVLFNRNFHNFLSSC